jgi:hypothetical protein
MHTPDPIRIDRRRAIQWILTAGAGAVLLKGRTFAADGAPPAGTTVVGYGSDPDIMKPYKAGDYWPLTFSGAQRRTVAALGDIVIPADARSPSASAVGVTDFVDEWVSAPYPDNVRDRRTIVEGLAWLEGESGRRFGTGFAGSSDAQRQTLCEDMAPDAPEHSEAGKASRFFRRFRDLVAVGYYTTPDGMKELGYVGNVPLARFDGPPAEVIAKLGLSDELKE